MPPPTQQNPSPVTSRITEARTRQRTKNPTIGNNVYGRKCRRTCLQCRKWKQKCDYRCLEEPCKLCRSRGFVCNAESKIRGPKSCRRPSDQPQTSDDALIASPVRCFSTDEAVTFLDAHYLRFLEEQQAHLPGYFPDNRLVWIKAHEGQPRTHAGCKTIAFWWPEFPLSSKVFRAATLSLASSQYAGGKLSPDTLHYLQRFYCHAKEAIRGSSVKEIVFASYAMQLYAITTSNEPLTALLIHFKGMCQAVYALLSQVNADSFLPTATPVLALWMMGLYALDQLYWASVNGTENNSDAPGNEIARKMYDVLDCPASIRCLKFLYIKATKSGTWTQYLEALRVYFSFHLDMYMYNGCSSRRSITSSTSLYRIVQLILLLDKPRADSQPETREISGDRSLDQLVPLVSFSTTRSIVFNSPDTALLPPSIYDLKATMFSTCANLTREILNYTADDSGPVIAAANNLALLCAAALASPLSQSKGLWICRCLFWAGVIITHHVNPIVHEWIMTQLKSDWELQLHLLPQFADELNTAREAVLAVFKAATFPEGHILDAVSQDGMNIFHCNRMLGKLYFRVICIDP